MTETFQACEFSCWNTIIVSGTSFNSDKIEVAVASTELFLGNSKVRCGLARRDPISGTNLPTSNVAWRHSEHQFMYKMYWLNAKGIQQQSFEALFENGVAGSPTFFSQHTFVG